MSRFDWYQATVQTDVRPLLGALEGACKGSPSWEQVSPKQGYGFGSRLADSDGDVCRVWWGGVHTYPHVISSGETAQVVSELLRSEYPDAHRVTRADACIDYAEPGAYDRLQAIALEVARERKVKVGTAGDHLLTMEGRTLYLGAPTSHTRLRLYDKAAEVRAKHRHDLARLEGLPDELARLECQVRPQTPKASLFASKLSPIELMGSSKWMRELMLQVAGLDLDPWQAGKAWRQSDDQRAYAAMLAQYGGMLGRLLGDLGSWDMVGRQIGHDLTERAKDKRRGGPL